MYVSNITSNKRVVVWLQYMKYYNYSVIFNYGLVCELQDKFLLNHYIALLRTKYYILLNIVTWKLDI